MTLPYQEAGALARAGLFLEALVDRRQTPRVPEQIRTEAARLLRHYPCRARIEELTGGERHNG